MEWAPANILNQSSISKTDAKNNAIGEHDAKRIKLEQQVEGFIDMDIDSDRIEVRYAFYTCNFVFVSPSI